MFETISNLSQLFVKIALKADYPELFELKCGKLGKVGFQILSDAISVARGLADVDYELSKFKFRIGDRVIIDGLEKNETYLLQHFDGRVVIDYILFVDKDGKILILNYDLSKYIVPTDKTITQAEIYDRLEKEKEENE